MSLHKFADMVAKQGRGDDSLLIHMTPDEVQRLQSFAEANGRSLTINPETGLPEAGMLSDLFKAVAPIALGAFLGPGAFGIAGLGLSAGTAGLVTGGLTTLATGSLSRGLMAGLGAYGGAGLAQGFADAGANALGAQGTAGALGVEGAATGAGSQAAMLAEQTAGFGTEGLSRLADSASVASGASPVMPSTGTLMSKGFEAAGASPMQFAKDNWKSLAAAAAPVMAGAMVPTTTSMPAAGNTGFIRQKIVNPDGTVRDLTPVKASEWGSRNFSDVYRGYKGGGIVALAGGGDVPAYFLANPDVAKAFDENAGGYATGLNAQQFADLHYATHGANEIATGTRAMAPSFTQAATAANVTPANALAALAYNPEMNASEFDVASSQYNLNNYNATSPLIHGYQVPDDQKTAALKYLQDNPDVAAWVDSQKKGGGIDYRAANKEFDPLDIAYTHYERYGQDEGRKWGVDKKIDKVVTTGTGLAGLNTGVIPGGNYGNATNPGDITTNADGTVTVHPNIPYRPPGGFSGMGEVKNAYTKGGGSLGYTAKAPTTIAEFNSRFNKMTGDSVAAYDYLMGKGAYPTKSGVGEISRPYREATLGYPESTNKMYNWDPVAGKMVRNPDYVAPGRDADGNVTYGMSLNDIKKALSDKPLEGQALYDWAMTNNLSAQDIADATGMKLSEVYSQFRTASQAAAKKKKDDAAAGITTLVDGGGGGDSGGPGGGGGGTGPGGVGGAGGPGSTTAANSADMGDVGDVDAVGGYYSRGKLHYRSKDMAMGGATGYAIGGGLGSLGSYSDGGRLLKGPGDGVSDSIPATIGAKRQPARLADGEFVIPARIVSELGNGSTDAGAKKLYAMMDRVQKARGKTTGKNKVAANSRADKYLPA